MRDLDLVRAARLAAALAAALSLWPPATTARASVSAPEGAQPLDAGHVLTLGDAVRLALAHNLNLQSSVDVVEGAQIGEELARSRFGVKVTPSYSRGFGDQSFVDQRFGVEVSKLLPFGATLSASWRNDIANRELGNFNSTDVGFHLRQPLLRGFGAPTTEFELVNSRRAVQGAERSLRLAEERLVVEVVASYYDIVRQRGLADVARKSVERGRELLRASEARLEVGLASKLDVFRAELQLSQAEESLMLRNEALELALDAFKFNVGLDPLAEVELAIVEPEYQPVEVDVAALTELAIQNRLELREERDRIRDARRALSISRQNLLPQVDLNVQYEQRGFGTSFADSFQFRDNALNAFLTTSYTLDRAAESASFALSQIDVAARERRLELTEHNVANEVRAAARNLERVGKSIVLQERNIEFAEKQLRLATLRYQRGLASNFDVIDAENNVIHARSNYVSLVSDYRVARINLKRVTGTLDIEREFAPGRHLPGARHHP